jgi:GNAT superfamily N-acetyltransferase|tara:strand:+ start:1068 stop:1508 length:441 start_codon:yes stop_codon:yes gene_type:complete
MNHATIEQSKEIYDFFLKNRDIFPHIRKDYLERNLTKGNVIYEDGVIVVYGHYQRKQRLGEVQAQKGDYIIHQILNTEKGNGKAGDVFERFFEYIDGNLWLCVRDENERAIRFYEKVGFEKEGKIYWKSGELPGTVFCKRKFDFFR